MKNHLKCILFAIMLILFAFCQLSYKQNVDNSYAFSIPDFEYVFSNSTINQENTITVTKSKSGENSTICEYASNLDDCLELIFDDLQNNSFDFDNTLINLSFDNFVMQNDWILNLNNASFLLGGNIIHQSQNTSINISNCDTINFENFELNSLSTNLINIDCENQLNLSIKNSKFYSSANNSYAICFNDTKTNLELSGQIVHTSTFLFYYDSNITLDCDDLNPCNISISVPNNLRHKLILSNITSSMINSLDFKPLNDSYKTNYECDWINNKLYLTSEIYFSSNKNGGNTFDEIKTSFKLTTETNLNNTLTKQSQHFAGWFGSVVVGETTYYFDSEMLANLSENNFDINYLKSNFAKSYSSLNNNYNFATLSNNESTLKLLKLSLMLNQKITLNAKWEYTLTIKDKENITSKNIAFDSAFDTATLSKTGFSLENCYLDENLKNIADFDIIRTDKTIYSKWNINNYKLTIYKDKSKSEKYEQTFDYNAQILFYKFSKEGHSVDSYKYFDDNDFLLTNMPANDVEIYTTYKRNKYSTAFETLTEEYISTEFSIFTEPVTKPSDPTREGYSFVKWIDKDTNESFDFGATPSHNRTAIAVWEATKHIATFCLDSNIEKEIAFEETINFVPIKIGFKFCGWKTIDGQNISLMPNADIYLYPIWQEKENISISLSSQSKYINNEDLSYELSSSIGGFCVEYQIDGSWTETKPNAVGSYNIKISRIEDENYKAFSKILKNGLQILPKQVSLKYYTIIMFFFFFIEICFIIMTKFTQNSKKSAPKLASVVLPFAIFETTDFVLACIATTCFVFGLIWLIVELVKLDKIKSEPADLTKYDNREIIKNIEDKSNYIEIEKRVDDLLAKNGFIEKKSNNYHEHNDKD